ncbi:hypothetical protein HZP42_07230 [Elizabethkingia anophelis]|uniref:hypothetical protein n=1 Tax=Elizabethkingia anophelis TaxID=1117645 RepID=UPI00066681AB|nr:hypothetical protein [Elizabethkingia anophelis]AQW89399.1 hypothetical protein BBD28_01435 [Elizabethkingia anophelis]KUY21906.1 hypothetical protein ATB94_16170 [Elizabethkingia anophelis]MCT3725651.1 hypothetical protein [Elizabethkingia anophelis]MCT4236174.1 hypothetical protein [Elizabethkingia anophelis]MDV3746813.1 hypothetical protein [Elizabethkingia anophelis]
MKKYIILCFLFFSFILFSQQNKDIVKESTYYFSLNQDQNFKGYGADFIKNKIIESQFFLIGEQHNIHSIETLITSLIPLFKENGYNHYITEIGPIAAKKLTELAESPLPLKDYYTKYSSQINLPPFGFFGTKEEEKTLQQLKKYSISLSGIDFESYGSYLFLIDELYKNSDIGKVSKDLYNKVYSFVESQYKNGKDNYNLHLMSHLLASKELKEFIMLSKNEINTPIITQLELSLNINHQITLGFWQRRVDNMKSNFARYYSDQSTKKSPVKAFIKLGAVHTARGTSFSGNLEVGNMIHELANVNQSKSFSVITFPRFIMNEKTGKVEDLVEDEDKELLKYTSLNQWTVIDLCKLEELSIQNSIKLSKDFINYIEKYDAIVIPPATKYSEKIY